MMQNCRRVLVVAAAAIVIAATPILAEDQGEEVVATPASDTPSVDTSYGERLFQSVAECSHCHGWAGDGIADDPRAFGANLRETSLSAEQIVQVIQCGRPGTQMPFFDRNAYTDGRCFGLTREDLEGQVPPIPISRFISYPQMEAVADYIINMFVGQEPMTYTLCVEQYGVDAFRCNKYAP